MKSAAVEIARFLLIFITVMLFALAFASCRSSSVPAAAPEPVAYFDIHELERIQAPTDSVRLVDYGYWKEERIIEKRAKDPDQTPTCWLCVAGIMLAGVLIFQP